MIDNSENLYKLTTSVVPTTPYLCSLTNAFVVMPGFAKPRIMLTAIGLFSAIKLCETIWTECRWRGKIYLEMSRRAAVYFLEYCPLHSPTTRNYALSSILCDSWVLLYKHGVALMIFYVVLTFTAPWTYILVGYMVAHCSLYGWLISFLSSMSLSISIARLSPMKYVWGLMKRYFSLSRDIGSLIRQIGESLARNFCGRYMSSVDLNGKSTACTSVRTGPVLYYLFVLCKQYLLYKTFSASDVLTISFLCIYITSTDFHLIRVSSWCVNFHVLECIVYSVFFLPLCLRLILWTNLSKKLTMGIKFN